MKSYLATKIIGLLRCYRDARRDASLREELTDFRASSDDEAESVAWRKVLQGLRVSD